MCSSKCKKKILLYIETLLKIIIIYFKYVIINILFYKKTNNHLTFERSFSSLKIVQVFTCFFAKIHEKSFMYIENFLYFVAI